LALDCFNEPMHKCKHLKHLQFETLQNPRGQPFDSHGPDLDPFYDDRWRHSPARAHGNESGCQVSTLKFIEHGADQH